MHFHELHVTHLNDRKYLYWCSLFKGCVILFWLQKRYERPLTRKLIILSITDVLLIEVKCNILAI